MKKLLVILMLISLSSCQWASRTMGGSTTVKVETGYMVTNATWKETDLWYFVQPMPEGYQPQTKRLVESSSGGLLEGEVTFIESK